MMASRRAACFFLGAWLGAALLVAWIAAENIRSVDRLLARPSPAAAPSIRALGAAGAQVLLHYAAWEQNRWLLRAWGAVQLIGGSAYFLFLLFGTREGKLPLALVIGMLGMVLLQL